MTRALAVLLLASLAAPARADDAATAYAAGTAAYARGDYTTAIAAFEAVFRADSRAEVAFTLAQAHRNQYFADHDVTHLQRALGLYRHYLAEAPSGRRAAHARLHLETIEAILASMPAAAAPAAEAAQPTQLLLTSDAPGARGSVDGGAPHALPFVIETAAGTHHLRVEAPGHDPADVGVLAVAERLVVVPTMLHAQPAQLVVRAGDSAQITVDGHAVAPTTTLPAGTHRVAIVARGRQPVTRDVELAAGATQTLDVELVPTARRRAARWTLYGAAGLAGSALVTGGIALYAQHAATSIFDARHDPADIDAYNQAVARRDTWRAVSIGLATTAGVAALTGAALWYFDVPRPAEHAPVLTPVISPESVGAAVVGRF